MDPQLGKENQTVRIDAKNSQVATGGSSIQGLNVGGFRFHWGSFGGGIVVGVVTSIVASVIYDWIKTL